MALSWEARLGGVATSGSPWLIAHLGLLLTGSSRTPCRRRSTGWRRPSRCRWRRPRCYVRAARTLRGFDEIRYRFLATRLLKPVRVPASSSPPQGALQPLLPSPLLQRFRRGSVGGGNRSGRRFRTGLSRRGPRALVRSSPERLGDGGRPRRPLAYMSLRPEAQHTLDDPACVGIGEQSEGEERMRERLAGVEALRALFGHKMLVEVGSAGSSTTLLLVHGTSPRAPALRVHHCIHFPQTPFPPRVIGVLAPAGCFWIAPTGCV